MAPFRLPAPNGLVFLPGDAALLIESKAYWDNCGCLIHAKKLPSSSTAPIFTRPPRALGFDIDYRKLLASFQKRGYLLRAYYYTALVEDQEYSSIRPLIDWLDYNGYKVVTKPAKEFTDSTGRRKIKGNMDIELTIDALELAEYVDHYVLFSGDGDFRTLVEALQRRGRKVSVVSTMTSQPPMISDDLRRQADHFIDLSTSEGRGRPRPVGTACPAARACRRTRRRLLMSAMPTVLPRERRAVA